MTEWLVQYFYLAGGILILVFGLCNVDRIGIVIRQAVLRIHVLRFHRLQGLSGVLANEDFDSNFVVIAHSSAFCGETKQRVESGFASPLGARLLTENTWVGSLVAGPVLLSNQTSQPRL